MKPSTVSATALHRQTIVDTNGQRVGYALALTPVSPPDAANEHARLGAGLRHILGNPSNAPQHTFLPVKTSFLDSPAIGLLPPESTVLELDFASPPDAALIARCRLLHERGFSLALGNYQGIDDANRNVLTLADYIVIDLSRCDTRRSMELSAPLQNLPIALIARNVASQEHLDECRQLGFECFQGAHVEPVEAIATQQPLPTPSALSRLLHQIEQRASLSTIESSLKKHAVLIPALIELSLSAKDGNHAPPGTLRNLLASIGLDRLEVWTRYQLATGDDDTQSYSHATPYQIAALRGRMLELLTQKLDPNNPRLADAAYLAGTLSALCDSDWSEPPPVILARGRHTQRGRRSTFTRSALFAQLLHALDRFDRNDTHGCEQSLRGISQGGLGFHSANACLDEALEWLVSA